MSTRSVEHRTFLSPVRVLILIAFLLFLYVVVPHIGTFSQSLTALRKADWHFVILAVAGLVITYGIASGTYYFLAQKQLSYRDIVLVQVASAFTNRVLPAGFGSMALNVQYLRKAQHTLPQAIAVASANNTLGFVGHMLVLGALLLIGQNAQPFAPDVSDALRFWPILFIIIMLLAAVLLTFRRLRRRIAALIAGVFKHLAYYRRVPAQFGAALCCSILLTICYIVIFYYSGQALGVDLPVLSFALVFTAGMIASSAVPTPGGLGGTEAGLTLGLMAYGVDPADALGVVLLYRFITYWLPLLPGFGVFLATRKLYLHAS